MARFAPAVGTMAVLVLAAPPAGAETARRALGTTLVSPPLAAAWTGAPHGPAELTVASSTLTALLEAADPSETGPAPWIARTALELALRFRFGHIAEIRLPAGLVFPAGALQSLDSGLPPPGPLGGGAGFGIAVSPEVGGGFYLGFLSELLVLGLPTDVVELCAAGCEPGSFSRSTGTAVGVRLRGDFLAGWKSGTWRAWFGVSLSHQPGGIDELLAEPDAVATVPFGNGFAVLSAGGECAVVEGLALFVVLQMPVAFAREGPWHGPILTGGMHAWVPDD
ncbi:MAG: hypothetical protein GYA57_04545 [Myxococcales bacterium]|nr:hypothetical protein [Myxococcales bacterium]